jgi:hypothetical protein
MIQWLLSHNTVSAHFCYYICKPNLTFRYRSLKSNDGNGSSTLVDLSKSFAQNVVIPMPKKKKKGSNRAGKTLFWNETIS